MAIIKCLECYKEISDKTNSCPNCGCPIAGIENIHQLSQEYDRNQLLIDSYKSNQ